MGAAKNNFIKGFISLTTSYICFFNYDSALHKRQYKIF